MIIFTITIIIIITKSVLRSGGTLRTSPGSQVRGSAGEVAVRKVKRDEVRKISLVFRSYFVQMLVFASHKDSNPPPGGGTLERKETGLSHGSLASRHLSASNVYTASPRGGTSLPRNSSMHPAILQSLPPNVGADGERSFVAETGDMSLQSLQYLESRGLFGSRESRSRRGSESQEGGGEGERRRRVSRRGGSDDESEVSAHSMSR